MDQLRNVQAATQKKGSPYLSSVSKIAKDVHDLHALADIICLQVDKLDHVLWRALQVVWERDRCPWSMKVMCLLTADASQQRAYPAGPTSFSIQWWPCVPLQFCHQNCLFGGLHIYRCSETFATVLLFAAELLPVPVPLTESCKWTLPRKVTFFADIW